MILGSSGQNIYPEEIEAKLNAIAPVAESLVVDGGDGHLVALIYLDPEATADMTPDQKMEAARAVVKGVNASLAAYEQIRDIEIMDSEFEKNSQALHQAISLPQTIIYQSSYPFTAVRLYAGMAAMATTSRCRPNRAPTSSPTSSSSLSTTWVGKRPQYRFGRKRLRSMSATAPQHGAPRRPRSEIHPGLRLRHLLPIAMQPHDRHERRPPQGDQPDLLLRSRDRYARRRADYPPMECQRYPERCYSHTPRHCPLGPWPPPARAPAQCRIHHHPCG